VACGTIKTVYFCFHVRDALLRFNSNALVVPIGS
jgi:hypothetical protein